MGIESLEGKGPRPLDPYIRILWAAKRGQGITLSADEVWHMSLDDAIATAASCRASEQPENQ